MRLTVPLLVLGVGAAVALVATPVRASAVVARYEVYDLRSATQVDAVKGTGVTVDGVEHGVAEISGTPAQISSIKRQGLTVRKAPAQTRTESAGVAADFPRGDSEYHTYNEMIAEINAEVASHPAIIARYSIGRSSQKRDIPIIKISDNVKVDENEPEVLYDAHQHAREHL